MNLTLVALDADGVATAYVHVDHEISHKPVSPSMELKAHH
jgi:hypothetical protein